MIKAAVTESTGGPLRVLELGELRADEVPVEVGVAGICHMAPTGG
jgi:Zn-dependent alcohol dehydrogenase